MNRISAIVDVTFSNYTNTWHQLFLPLDKLVPFL